MLHVARVGALVIMATASAEAQELAGTFDQLRVLVKSGETLTVIDNGGARIRGQLSQLSGSSLILNVSGLDREFQSSQVDAIEKRGPDPLKNGALTGFVIGGVLGGVGLAALTDGTGTGNVAAAVLGGLLYGGMGAGIGVGVDALIEGERVIYATSAPRRTAFTIAPILSGRGKGVLLTLSLSR
jgi:hypothetical protein